MTLINLHRFAAKAFEQVDVIVPYFLCSHFCTDRRAFSHACIYTHSLCLHLCLFWCTVIHKLCSVLIIQGDKSNCSATLNLWGLMLVSGAVLSAVLYCMCVSVCVPVFVCMRILCVCVCGVVFTSLHLSSPP